MTLAFFALELSGAWILGAAMAFFPPPDAATLVVMVVASWINLQYYGSAVDNRVFGSGNKVLHNVVGALGVLEGNGGDLRAGLPWQSVHDGERSAAPECDDRSAA